MKLEILAFYKFFLLLIRASFIVFFVPVIGSRVVPSAAKIALSAFLAFLGYSLVPQKAVVIPPNFVSMSLDVLREAVMGVAIGFASRLVFDGIQFGGQYIGYMMGFAVVNVLEPQSETHVPLISQFQNILAVLVFLAIGGHLWFFSAFSDSLRMLPLGTVAVKAPLVVYLAKLFGSIFLIAIKVNVPIFFVLFLIQLVMAVVARVVPQMNIFMVGFPVQIAVGFFLLWISIKAMVFLFSDLFQQMRLSIYEVIKLLGG